MPAEIMYTSDTGGIDGVVILYGLLAIASLVAYVVILRKAGYSGWAVLLAFIPLVNVVAFFVFAFSDWPVRKQLRESQRAYQRYVDAQNRRSIGLH